MRYLSVKEVLRLHDKVIEQTGGTSGIRDQGALESAVAQPQMTFGGEELYPTLVEKAAALGFSLAMNHSFVDGNKRTAHASMEVFLVFNGFEIQALVDDQEVVMLNLARGTLKRDEFTAWLHKVVIPLTKK
ncbi:MAG: type II toxin-antitoxin system death-on-curing family toxin [Coleofasciculaceae cyanobacterium]